MLHPASIRSTHNSHQYVHIITLIHHIHPYTTYNDIRRWHVTWIIFYLHLYIYIYSIWLHGFHGVSMSMLDLWISGNARKLNPGRIWEREANLMNKQSEPPPPQQQQQQQQQQVVQSWRSLACLAKQVLQSRLVTPKQEQELFRTNVWRFSWNVFAFDAGCVGEQFCLFPVKNPASQKAADSRSICFIMFSGLNLRIWIWTIFWSQWSFWNGWWKFSDPKGYSQAPIPQKWWSSTAGTGGIVIRKTSSDISSLERRIVLLFFPSKSKIPKGQSSMVFYWWKTPRLLRLWWL